MYKYKTKHGGVPMYKASAWIPGKGIFRILVMATVLVVAGSLPSTAKGEEYVLASRIIDVDVFDEKGQEIGEVDDLIIRRSGMIKKIALEIGGFLDIGDKLIAVSSNKLRMEDGKVIVQQPKEQLEKKQEFDYWRQGLRPGYYYHYFHRPRYPYYRHRWGYPLHGPAYPPPGDDDPQGLYEWSFSPGHFLASVAMNRLIVNADGVHIGWLEDFLIDKDTSKVMEVVINAEDHRGEQEPYVAVPYRPLGFGPFGILYNISAEKVKDLPGYLYED
jgi:sporulation protein YlmC with PRC-barrel domain